MLRKLQVIIATHGFRAVPWRAYSYVYKRCLRPLLPYGAPVLFSGIDIGVRRTLGDAHASRLYLPPGDVADIPDYEAVLIEAIRSAVRPGDRVVIVGGGLGVTAVVAAQCASPSGSVTCFEGDLEGVTQIRRAAATNAVDDRLHVEHAIVGENIGVYGSSFAMRSVRPADLPECDLLELDCEGAEVGILREMTIQPRTILVETHGYLGSPSSTVEAVLRERGYSIRNLGLAEPRLKLECLKNDVSILAGKLE